MFIIFINTFQEALSGQLVPGAMRMCGVLGIEHCGTGKKNDDGICTTVLACLDLRNSEPPSPLQESNNYKWQPLNDTDLINYLINAMKGGLVPIL